MKQIKSLAFFGLLTAFSLLSQAQKPVDSIKFFTDEQLIEMTLTTDIRSLQNEKKVNVFQKANVDFHFPDSTIINEEIRVGARGHFRRDNCTIPPLWLNFHNSTSPQLNNLGRLKLVIGCGSSSDNEQLILKEFLIYKMYNLLEKKSYRARLVKVNYRDTRGKVKSFSQFAFFLEDDKDMAVRNKCVKKPDRMVMTENTHRATMTMVALFEYMVSNGDWSVPHFHNIHLIYPKDDGGLPYAVPYDFDHSGLVNAGYALPPEMFGTESVTERVYRGYPRTMAELEAAFEVYEKQKDDIYALINNSPYLKDKVKKDMIQYIGQFYSIINNKNQVQKIFIDNARKD